MFNSPGGGILGWFVQQSPPQDDRTQGYWRQYGIYIYIYHGCWYSMTCDLACPEKCWSIKKNSCQKTKHKQTQKTATPPKNTNQEKKQRKTSTQQKAQKKRQVKKLAAQCDFEGNTWKTCWNMEKKTRQHANLSPELSLRLNLLLFDLCFQIVSLLIIFWLLSWVSVFQLFYSISVSVLLRVVFLNYWFSWVL